LCETCLCARRLAVTFRVVAAARARTASAHGGAVRRSCPAVLTATVCSVSTTRWCRCMWVVRTASSYAVFAVGTHGSGTSQWGSRREKPALKALIRFLASRRRVILHPEFFTR
jgi:hypothetical protein